MALAYLKPHLLMSAQMSQRKQPYSKPRDVRATSDTPKSSVHPQSPTAHTLSSSGTSSTSSALTSTSLESSSCGVARELYIEFMQEAYPDITPRDDHDLVMLGSTKHEGSTAEIFTWVDKKMENHIKIYGSRTAVMANAKELLDGIVGVTGVRYLVRSRLQPLMP